MGELLPRTSPLRPGKRLTTLVVATTLALSASYEFFEWGVALVPVQGADHFLATQGNPWDTQWDMFLAISGAVAALILLRRAHDRSLRRRTRAQDENWLFRPTRNAAGPPPELECDWA